MGDAGDRDLERDRVRHWQITREVFDRYGATPNCPKCTAWTNGTRSSRNHSITCRRRLEQALRHDPIFGPRIVESTTRLAQDGPLHADRRRARPDGEPARPDGEPARLEDEDDRDRGDDREARDREAAPENQEAAPENQDAMHEDTHDEPHENKDDVEMHDDDLVGKVNTSNPSRAPDKNTQEDEEKLFIPDLPTDAWEADRLDGISPDLITQAKRAELAQLSAMDTFEIVPRESLSKEIKTVGTKWVPVNKGAASIPR